MSSMLDEPTTTSSALGGPPAGFWRRFASSFIDGLILGVVSTILRYATTSGLGTLLGFIIAGAYFIYFHGSTGRTPGNAALGITVVSITDGAGRPIGYGRAAGRWLMSYVS